MEMNEPPAVVMLISHVKALADPFDKLRKARNGKIMTTQKHQIGTPFLVV